MTTYCEDCEHVLDKKPAFYRWQCMKHPRLEGNGYVTRKVRETEPYLFCKDVNGGGCPLFRKEKGNQMELDT